MTRNYAEPVWISLVPREKALARARKLERDPVASVRPLYGVPFAIKDNIDLAGLPTTAGCPGISPIQPARSAPWCRTWWTPARFRSARPIWISSPPAW